MAARMLRIVGTALLADGDNWVDAVAAGGLSRAYSAPVLLTRHTTELEAVVADYITGRLAATPQLDAWVVGGRAAVPAAVECSTERLIRGDPSAC